MAEINKYIDTTDFVRRNRYDETVIKSLVDTHNRIIVNKVHDLNIVLTCTDTIAKLIEAYIPREEW
jgi:UDP-N-acetylglucosamine transferase subunit ALG13